MEIRLLKTLFDEGLLIEAIVEPAPMEQDRWVMTFNKSSGNTELITKARDDKPKIYKRINGALQDAKEIGFKQVVIRFI